MVFEIRIIPMISGLETSTMDRFSRGRPDRESRLR
jgi:hypothetical protein